MYVLVLSSHSQDISPVHAQTSGVGLAFAKAGIHANAHRCQGDNLSEKGEVSEIPQTEHALTLKGAELFHSFEPSISC